MSLERIVGRIYSWSLRAFPARHRTRYDVEMLDTFERELAALQAHSRLQALRFASAACVNAVSEGLGERRRYRDAGFTPALGLSAIDFTLAWRMLVRYPGLSVASILGLSVGIAIAAGASTVVFTLLNPAVPLPDGDRVVSIVNLDAATGNSESRVMHDFAEWQHLTSLRDVGASVTVGRTLITEGGRPDTVAVAQMSSSGFRLAAVPPARGRYLLPEDERADAPDVVVIGHDVWQRRFFGDPRIVGRTIQLGNTAYSVVGVMPEGFAFPVNHSYWIAWRLDPGTYEPRTGPPLTVFARLAADATIESAQAELAPLGQRLAAASPATHQHLRPRIVPYTYAFSGMAEPDNALALRAMQMAVVMLLVVVCVNVAILVYARTATRQGEIAVRTALGASRRRIVAQLFAEALLLAGVSAAAGIGLMSLTFAQLDAALRQFAELPFWMTLRVSTAAVGYVVGLALFAAAIVGVIPALKATGRGVQTRLQGLSPGSGSRMQMGRLWTGLIVAQVALTVAVLPAAMYHAWQSLVFRTADPGFATRDFVSAQIILDRSLGQPRTAAEAHDLLQTYAGRQMELERRLEREPGVIAATFSLTDPGEELAAVLEVDGLAPPSDLVDYNIVEGSKQGHLVRFNRVALDFFAAFEVPVLLGRGLQRGDQGVLVNRALVDSLFGGANPLGRRIRYVGRSREAADKTVELDRWFDVVGVVPDFPTPSTFGAPPERRVYHAAMPGEVYPAMLSVRIRGNVSSTFSGTLREIGASVDPELQLRDVASFEADAEREQRVMRLIGATVAAAMLSVVVLSAAGIYALMSFTVARRTREIGIRVALGANPARILGGIFSRVFGQLALGAAAGMGCAIALERLLGGEMFQGHGAVILPAVAVVMSVVGVIAAVGPARRGLGVDPTTALRED